MVSVEITNDFKSPGGEALHDREAMWLLKNLSEDNPKSFLELYRCTKMRIGFLHSRLKHLIEAGLAAKNKSRYTRTVDGSKLIKRLTAATQKEG